MSFDLTPSALEWQAKIRRFVDDELIPWEVEAEMNDGEIPPDVADRHEKMSIELGLSRGIVNFHFESKDKLLVETLRTLSEEYRNHWQAALAAAGPSAAEKLLAFVHADFDRKVCTQRKLAAWGAFWGEAKSRPTYRSLCGANDEEYQDAMEELCVALAEPGHKPALIALGIVCMMDGLWHHLMMKPKEFRREEALSVALAHLGAVYPSHFTPEGHIRASVDNKTDVPA